MHLSRFTGLRITFWTHWTHQSHWTTQTYWTHQAHRSQPHQTPWGQSLSSTIFKVSSLTLSLSTIAYLTIRSNTFPSLTHWFWPSGFTDSVNSHSFVQKTRSQTPWPHSWLPNSPAPEEIFVSNCQHLIPATAWGRWWWWWCVRNSTVFSGLV